MTGYWWANQSDNFDRVQGTLWTNFVNEVGTRRPGAAALGSTRPGDVVFHCDRQFIRTISQVISEPVVAYRPSAYLSRQSGSESDEGWFVLVEPLATELRIDRREDLSSIELGGTGPFNKLGGLKRGVYLSPVPESSAVKLLALAGVEVAEIPPADHEVYTHPFSGPGSPATDGWVLAKRRVEQRYLRSVLLEESEPQCAICHREVPENLLVAGHIKPRWACTEEERKSFASIAMLVCLLGCDSLYERGLIAVDADGIVTRTSQSVTPDVDQLLDELVGNRCRQHNDTTAGYFQWHRDNTFIG